MEYGSVMCMEVQKNIVRIPYSFLLYGWLLYYVATCSYWELVSARETYGMDGEVAIQDLGKEDIAFQDFSFYNY